LLLLPWLPLLLLLLLQLQGLNSSCSEMANIILLLCLIYSSCVIAAHLRAQHACCCLLAAVAPFLPISAARKMALLVLRSVPCSVVHMQSHSH
jgi:hypothetical protein